MSPVEDMCVAHACLEEHAERFLPVPDEMRLQVSRWCMRHAFRGVPIVHPVISVLQLEIRFCA